MKNLIKIHFAFIFCFASVNISGQSLWLNTGLNWSNFTTPDPDYNELSKRTQGFNLGLILDFEISNAIHFETGLVFNNRGAKIEEDLFLEDIVIEVTSKANLVYIDVPMNAKVYLLNGDMKLYTLAGAYLGYGVDGTNSFTTNNPDFFTDTKDAVRWGNDPGSDDLKRLDYGLLLGTGFEFKQFHFGLSYLHGIANISPETVNGTYGRNRVLSFHFGFRIATIEADSW